MPEREGNFSENILTGCTNNTGCICIDSYVVLSELHCICLCQASDCPFACAVMRQQGERFEGNDGSGPDDLPWLLRGAVSLTDHLLGGFGITILNSKNVDSKHTLEVLFCEIKQSLDLGDSSVRDPAIRFNRRRDTGA